MIYSINIHRIKNPAPVCVSTKAAESASDIPYFFHCLWHLTCAEKKNVRFSLITKACNVCSCSSGLIFTGGSSPWPKALTSLSTSFWDLLLLVLGDHACTHTHPKGLNGRKNHSNCVPHKWLFLELCWEGKECKPKMRKTGTVPLDEL